MTLDLWRLGRVEHSTSSSWAWGFRIWRFPRARWLRQRIIAHVLTIVRREQVRHGASWLYGPCRWSFASRLARLSWNCPTIPTWKHSSWRGGRIALTDNQGRARRRSGAVDLRTILVLVVDDTAPVSKSNPSCRLYQRPHLPCVRPIGVSLFGSLALAHHVSPKHLVYFGLVPSPACPEPGKHVLV